MKNPYENLISENFKEYERGLYDRYPTFLIPENQIKSGYDRLVENIKEEGLSGKRVLVIDGYNGVNWDLFKSSISKINVALGGITPPAPLGPYPSSDGIINVPFSPVFRTLSASSQPLMTCPTPVSYTHLTLPTSR